MIKIIIFIKIHNFVIQNNLIYFEKINLNSKKWLNLLKVKVSKTSKTN